MLSSKTCNFLYKTCSLYVLLTQWSFSISHQNVHLGDMHYKWLRPNCSRCKYVGDIEAMKCDNACRELYKTSSWPRSLREPSIQRDYVKHEAVICDSHSVAHCLKVWRLCDVGLLPRIGTSRIGVALGGAWNSRAKATFFPTLGPRWWSLSTKRVVHFVILPNPGHFMCVYNQIEE